MKERLTYFTPTYNRASLLPNLYESLKKQKNKNFTWLIIDDGSQDGTKELVKNWEKENLLKIKYVFKENGGKNTAIDLSNKICETEFITCIDSDDILHEDCTDVLYSYFDVCCKDKNCAGIVARKAHFNGKPFNDSWAKTTEFICFYDIPRKYGYTQDSFLIFKTDIIKNYKFPNIQDEKFITEAVLYRQFLYDFSLVMIPECLYLAEYRDSGYTAQGIFLFFKNPKGHLYNLKQNLYIAINKKLGFKKACYRAALYYAWKNVVKVEDEFKNIYKIPFIYKIVGNLLQIIEVRKLKLKYKEFKNVKNR